MKEVQMAKKKTGMKMKLTVKKRRYRNAYYLKENQSHRLNIRAAQEKRTASEIVQDALEMYLAAHPNN